MRLWEAFKAFSEGKKVEFRLKGFRDPFGGGIIKVEGGCWVKFGGEGSLYSTSDDEICEFRVVE